MRRDGAYDANTRNSVQNVPLDNPSITTDAYDPDATVKSPALTSLREATPATAAGTLEEQSVAHPSASQQYERPTGTDSYDGREYDPNSSEGTKR